MSQVDLFLLILQGVVFTYWTFEMFRNLARMRKRSMKKTGKVFPGLMATLGEFETFISSPEDRRDRNRLALVTLVLFGLIALACYVNSKG